MVRRTGVTLLEVLFSIGIVAVGLLGVLITLVVAGRTTADGVLADGADSLGRSAVREFRARGLNRPTGRQGTWAAVPVAGQSYCLDPLGVAELGTASPACYFPAFAQASVPGPRMARVSLRPFPGDQSTSPQPPIVGELAETIFRGRDDLSVVLPDDHTAAPVQQFAAAGKRSSFGSLSWFATVQAADYTAGQAEVSIVVCNRRDFTGERLLDVAAIDDSLFKIAARPGQSDEDLAVRSGEWLMLAGIDANSHQRFAWYRVLSVSGTLPAGAADVDGSTWPTATRTVTLAIRNGRQWQTVPASTQATNLGCVVAVYERTFRVNGG